MNSLKNKQLKRVIDADSQGPNTQQEFTEVELLINLKNAKQEKPRSSLTIEVDVNDIEEKEEEEEEAARSMLYVEVKPEEIEQLKVNGLTRDERLMLWVLRDCDIDFKEVQDCLQAFALGSDFMRIWEDQLKANDQISTELSNFEKNAGVIDPSDVELMMLHLLRHNTVGIEMIRAYSTCPSRRFYKEHGEFPPVDDTVYRIPKEERDFMQTMLEYNLQRDELLAFATSPTLRFEARKRARLMEADIVTEQPDSDEYDSNNDYNMYEEQEPQSEVVEKLEEMRKDDEKLIDLVSDSEEEEDDAEETSDDEEELTFYNLREDEEVSSEDSEYDEEESSEDDEDDMDVEQKEVEEEKPFSFIPKEVPPKVKKGTWVCYQQKNANKKPGAWYFGIVEPRSETHVDVRLVGCKIRTDRVTNLQGKKIKREFYFPTFTNPTGDFVTKLTSQLQLYDGFKAYCRDR